MQEKFKPMADLAREVMADLGVKEIQPSPYGSQNLMDAANIDGDSWERDFVEQPNPDGDGKVYMRTILMPSMLETLGSEYAAKVEAVRAFEIGKTYTKNYVIPGAAPFECWNLSVGLYGEAEDLSTLAGVITALLEKMGIIDVEFLVEEEYSTYHPEQCARIVTKDFSGQIVELGIMGELHPEVKKNFGIGGNAYGGELFFDLIAEFADRARQYDASMMNPSASIDASILEAESAQLDELERQIRALFGVVNGES